MATGTQLLTNAAARFPSLAMLRSLPAQVPVLAGGDGRLWGCTAAVAALVVALRFVLTERGVPSGRRRVKSAQALNDGYDVVIIGGGTAGCVLASRLSEDPDVRVLLLEAGKSSSCAPYLRVPAFFPKVFHSEADYNLYTEPQAHAGLKRKYWPRGKVLGGCSSVNAMIFHHGAPSDFDEWAELQKGQDGSGGWSYQQLYHYFKKFEKYHPSEQYSKVDALLRGSSGPVHVGYFGHTAESTKMFLEACDNAGIVHNPDLNTRRGTLGSTKTMTFMDSRGQRVSTESAYLTPEVLARPNLQVVTEARVLNIVFEHCMSGKQTVPRAVGVRFSNARGETVKVKARKEVVVSAGAIHTPQILMLSGVGPAEHLASHGIPVIADLPGVGSRLMDHAVVDFHFMDKRKEAASGFTMADIRERPGLSAVLKFAVPALQFQVLGTGLLTTNLAEAITFVRSSDKRLFPKDKDAPEDTTSGPGAPDIEIFFTPLTYLEHGDKPFAKGHHFALHAVLLRPTSMGTVRLRSADPDEAPVIDPQYLSTDHDTAVFVRAARLVSRIAQTEPMASLIDPAGDASTLLNHRLHALSDAEVVELVRERVETLYHPTSTARMAPWDEGGVVDPFLRVHGIPNLRVVDASVFPTITSGHTSAPTIAVAEKAADIIKKALN